MARLAAGGFLVLLATVASVAPARADEPAPAPAIAPPSAAPITAVDPVWAQYDAAYAALVKGDREHARALLAELVAKSPDHPAAAFARDYLTSLASGDATATPQQDDDDENNGKPSKAARGEFVFWQTASSGFVAFNLCRIANCQSARANAAVYGLVVGGALAGTFYVSRAMHQGQAQLYNSAPAWTVWTSLAFYTGAHYGTGQAIGELAAQGAGIGLAALLWDTWRPSQGDIALTNTIFTWGTVMTLFGELIADKASLRATVIAGDVALIGGALLSTQYHVSRGRTLLLDTGGVLGFLAGGLVAVLGKGSSRETGVELGLGTGVGLAAAAFFTKDWDPPAVVKDVKIVPAPIQPVAGATSAFGLGAAIRF